MYKLIQKKYDFTDYQIAQLQYTVKSVFSELSKIIILVILFHNQLVNFLVASLLLCTLRIYSGGLHCKTYIGCLLTSIVFFVITFRLALPIYLSNTVEYLLLIMCILIGFCIRPVTAKCHKKLEPQIISFCRTIYLSFLCLFLLAMYIIPDNSYLHIGFWVIILHTLQLSAAKILQKGARQHEEKLE